MSIEDGVDGNTGMAQVDPNYSFIVVIFNVCPTEVSLEIPSLKSRKLQLHPVQLNSADDLVKQSSNEPSSGSFTIPRRTTSVFVEVRCCT
ncbi:pullulanase 1, chloroplastic-like [Canna indica]|uniref:Pullulanase 1, chloroplastic-like n=1 Tax=Canna indica TaxID=4628 RepID=A0AAQ3QEU9_9LILI|nr:pullulanase 1, chloroplastic-like [Canna indica]